MMAANAFSASHPLWMRGLKYLSYYLRQLTKKVASFMDAWIEIIVELRAKAQEKVASFMDAWIEI